MIGVVQKVDPGFPESFQFKGDQFIFPCFQEAGRGVQRKLRPLHTIAAQVEAVEEKLSVGSERDADIGVGRGVQGEFRPVDTRTGRFRPYPEMIEQSGSG